MKKLFAIILFVLSFSAISVSAKDLPILMYHSMDNENSYYSVTAEKFEHDIYSLWAQGYTTVSFADVINYVENGAELPEKPVVITFDDGYPNNADVLLPLAEKMGVDVEIFLVAGFVEYSDLGMNWQQARLIENSPVGATGCHTFNLHSAEEGGRYGVVRMGNESFREWEHTFRHDLALADYFFRENSLVPTTFAYPYGNFSPEADRILRENGYKVTVTTQKGINRIEKGDIESLYMMLRISMDGVENTAAEEIKKYEGIYATEKVLTAKSNVWNEINVSRYEALEMLYGDKIEVQDTPTKRKLDWYLDMKYQPERVKDVFAWCMDKGIISGYPDYTLRPECYITRGEFALLLSDMTGYDEREATHLFEDSSDWNEKELSWCYEKGYMIGYGDKFGVNDFLTKEQIELVCKRIWI